MAKPEVHTFDQPFTTESGAVLEQPHIAFQSWGTLNEKRDNVIFVCHALTGNTEANEWFGGLFGKNKPFDPNRYFIICPNILGSCYGTTGPNSINPKTGKTYQADFPEVTIRDMVRFNQLLLDELDINGIELMIGGSLGGMTALEFAIMDDRVKHASVIATSIAHSAWAIGISEAQRMAIYADENWKGGFYDDEHPPAKGLAAARAMAMITYRTPENYGQKFGREIHPQKHLYQVESYLNYQGQKLVERFDANSYITLSKAMDTHDVARGRGTFEEVLGELKLPVLVIGFTTDKLYPIEEQRTMARLIPFGQLAELSSPYGHDAFLIEFDQLNQQLSEFLTHTQAH